MASEKLIKNTVLGLRGTLFSLSSADEQRAYKNAVPYVDVPGELICQWKNYAEIAKKKKWFKNLLLRDHAYAILRFDKKVDKLLQQHKTLWDIPVALTKKAWLDLMEDAEILLNELKELFDEYESK